MNDYFVSFVCLAIALCAVIFLIISSLMPSKQSEKLKAKILADKPGPVSARDDISYGSTGPTGFIHMGASLSVEQVLNFENARIIDRVIALLQREPDNWTIEFTDCLSYKNKIHITCFVNSKQAYILHTNMSQEDTNILFPYAYSIIKSRSDKIYQERLQEIKNILTVAGV